MNKENVGEISEVINYMREKKKTGINRFDSLILITFICTIQATLALTLSLNQIRRITTVNKPDVVLYNLGTLILFLLLFSMNMLFRKPLIVSFAFSLFWNVIALINYYTILFHGTVLTHQDVRNITTAVDVIGSYTFKLTNTVGAILLSFSFISFILALIYYKDIRIKTKRLYGVISLCVLICISYILVYSPISIVNYKQGWSWERKYYSDGFVIGTMENIGRTINLVNKPNKYTISEISDVNGLNSEITDYPDVIMILNETYYDLDYLMDFDTDITYMKNYDVLDAYKGYATVAKIGGGTNASEYELLTGNSLTLLNTYTPFNDLKLDNHWNIAKYLSKLGYTTMAAHPKVPGNYHRAYAWKQMGFNHMFFDTDFLDCKYYGQRWLESDKSVFENFKRFYSAMPSDKPRFAYLLTIQNHGDWDSNDSEFDQVHIQKDNGLSDFNCQRVNEFLTCMKQTDDCINDIIEYFSGIDRKVVVYMVGDHSPSFVSEIGDKTSDSNSSENINLKKRMVPYFIWANYDADFSELPDNHNIDLCSLTACVLCVAGLPLSPYYNQLLKISDCAQCFTGIEMEGENKNTEIGFVDKQGETVSIDADTSAAQLIRQYYFMEYNSFQTKERIEKLFAPK